MVFVALVIGIVLPILIIQCIQWNREGDTYGFGVFCGCTITGMIIVEIICICESIYEPQPKAIDVYQGKTTLEYTIRDGEVIDSVVVFKENYYKK